MYYFMTKAVFRSELKSKTFSNNKSYMHLREKENSLLDFKFYQKLFLVLISLSIILIFPETPRELENICENYNSKNLCNVF